MQYGIPEYGERQDQCRNNDFRQSAWPADRYERQRNNGDKSALSARHRQYQQRDHDLGEAKSGARGEVGQNAVNAEAPAKQINLLCHHRFRMHESDECADEQNACQQAKRSRYAPETSVHYHHDGYAKQQLRDDQPTEGLSAGYQRRSHQKRQQRCPKISELAALDAGDGPGGVKVREAVIGEGDRLRQIPREAGDDGQDRHDQSVVIYRPRESSIGAKLQKIADQCGFQSLYVLSKQKEIPDQLTIYPKLSSLPHSSKRSRFVSFSDKSMEVKAVTQTLGRRSVSINGTR